MAASWRYGLEESELPNTRTARSIYHLRVVPNQILVGPKCQRSLLDFLLGRESRLVEGPVPTSTTCTTSTVRRVALRLTWPHPLVMSQLPFLSPEESSESAGEDDCQNVDLYEKSITWHGTNTKNTKKKKKHTKNRSICAKWGVFLWVALLVVDLPIPNWGTTQVHRKGAKPHSKGRWFHHVKHDTTKPLRSHRKLYHLRDWEIFSTKIWVWYMIM